MSAPNPKQAPPQTTPQSSIAAPMQLAQADPQQQYQDQQQQYQTQQQQYQDQQQQYQDQKHNYTTAICANTIRRAGTMSIIRTPMRTNMTTARA
jgi:hypothetical protein